MYRYRKDIFTDMFEMNQFFIKLGSNHRVINIETTLELKLKVYYEVF